MDEPAPDRPPAPAPAPAPVAADERPAAAVQDPRDWTGHVIVCGLHGVGMRTVEQLYLAGVRAVVLDDDPTPRLVPVLAGWGVPYVAGSAVLSDPLYAAGLEGAIAVVCAEESDLRTLETALLVRDLRSDVRVVVHLNNPAVGRAIAQVTGEGRVLDIAALFAPSVVEACLGLDAHEFEVGGEHFESVTIEVSRTGTLRELYGDLTPVGIVCGATEQLIVCPGRDVQVATGDRVTLVAPPSALAAAGVPTHGVTAMRRQRRSAGRMRRALRTVSDHSDRAVRVTLWLSGAMVLLSTLILLLGYRTEDGGRMTPIEAIYFTVETAATVGFGDFSFAAQSGWLQVFAIALILAGTTLVSMIFALVTNILVSRNIEQSFGYGRVRGMQDHTVVIGLGSIGLRVCEGLVACGQEVVVVERDLDNRYIAQARALDVPVILGDATLGQTLDRVNLAAAASVAIMTSDDLTNIEAALAVRDRLGPRWPAVPVVLRVFDRSLGRRLEDSFEFRHVWSAFAIAAPWFVGAAIGLGVLATFYVGSVPFLVGRLTVRRGGGLDGLAMRDLSARIRVLALQREGEPGLLHPLRREATLAAGDVAFLAGPYEELLRVLRREETATAGGQKG